MKLPASLLLLAAAAVLVPAARAQSGQCTLIAHIDGFRNNKGDAGGTLFKSPDGWPENNNKAFMHAAFPIQNEKSTVKFTGLQPGVYGFAAIHDENENHKLDRNMFGIPKEGFGFANNPHVAFSAPSFQAASFHVTCPVTEITVHLIYK